MSDDIADIPPPVQDAFSFFVTTETIRSTEKSRANDHMKCIENYSRRRGLPSEMIEALIKVIINVRLPITLKKNLIYCLLPTDKVTEKSVLCVVSCLGLTTVSPSVKVELFKWLLVIWSSVEPKGKETLRFWYEVIFSFINIGYLSPYICHLLYILTQPEHVTRHHVETVIALQNRFGPHPHIVLLLNLYHTFNPSIVHVKLTKRVRFKSLGSKLLSLYANLIETLKHESAPNEATRAAVLKESVFGRKLKIIDSSTIIQATSEKPKSLFKILDSPLRAVILAKSGDQCLFIRLENWLKADVFYPLCNWEHPKEAEKIFAEMLKLSEELRSGIHAIQNFLSYFLQEWDGYKYQSTILGHISWWNLCPFQEFFDKILTRLQCLCENAPLDFQCNVLECLTKLLEYWAIVECKRLEQINDRHALSCIHLAGYVVSEDSAESIEDPTREVDNLLVYLGEFCDWLLVQNPNHPAPLMHHIIDVYKTALCINLSQNFALLRIPSFSMFSACILSFSTPVLSRFTNLIWKYKMFLSRLKKRGTISELLNFCLFQLNEQFFAIYRLFCGIIDSESETSLPIHTNRLPDELKAFVHDPCIPFCLWKHPAIVGVILADDFLHTYISTPIEELQRNVEFTNRFTEQLIAFGLESLLKIINLVSNNL